MKRPAVVAVNVDGVVTTHMPHQTGSYATLCGIDGDDPHKHVNQSLAKVPQGSKINCHDCKALWTAAKQFISTDFE